MTRILLVEDDAPLSSAVRSTLERAGYEVDVAPDGAAALRALTGATYAVVLLDIGLPFVDGYRVLASLESGRLPSVIVISARHEERDKVRALDMGADDYLSKPFGADELLARIRAVLRRAQPGAGPVTSVRIGGIAIDLAARTVVRDGAEVALSPTEYGLLAALARRAGSVADHRTLLREVWGAGYLHERSYLRTFVQRLRRKLEVDPHDPEVIITVGARGYRLGPLLLDGGWEADGSMNTLPARGGE